MSDDNTDPNDYDIDPDDGTTVASTRDSTNNISYGLHRLDLDGEDVYALTSTVATGPRETTTTIRDIGRLSFEAAEVDREAVNEAVTDAGLEPLTDEQLAAVQEIYDESIGFCLWEAMADARHGEAFAIVKDRAYYEDMAYPEGWQYLENDADVTPEQIDVITSEISRQMGHGWVQTAVHAEYEADIVIDPLGQDELSKLENTDEGGD